MPRADAAVCRLTAADALTQLLRGLGRSKDATVRIWASRLLKSAEAAHEKRTRKPPEKP